jgi:hypothetical protein
LRDFGMTARDCPTYEAEFHSIAVPAAPSKPTDVDLSSIRECGACALAKI